MEIFDRQQSQSTIDRILGSDMRTSAILAEIANTQPEELVDSQALRKAIEERDIIRNRFVRELLETSQNSDTSKIYLGDASQLVMAIAAKVPQEEREKHAGDADVMATEMLLRKIEAQNAITGATASGISKQTGKESGIA